MREHTLHSCNESDCRICEGGLSFCTTCKGGEGSLTTECCGRPLTEVEEWMIYDIGVLDFVGEQWVLNAVEA